jgi:PEP-CTERM motif
VKKLTLISAAILAIGLTPTANAALSVSSGQTANGLVNSLLSGSSGITFSNASTDGTSNQNGTFTGGISAGLSFDSGIVLSSGNVNDLPLASKGSASGADSDVGSAGDSKLSTLINDNTNNASVLKFDFVPTGDKVEFTYVFGSTEYNSFVNSSFNDVFAFFVNDVNKALIPGTNTPVSINNVNCGHADGPTGPGNLGDLPATNCDKFVNNRTSNSAVGENLLINLGGFTLTFSFVADVIANQTNTMYLAIADTSDDVLDSAVFIAGKSFSTCGGVGQPTCGTDDDGGTDTTDGSTDGGNEIPEPATLSLLGLAIGLGLARRARK